MWEMIDRHQLTSSDITTNKIKTSRNIKKNPYLDFKQKLSQPIVGLNTDSNEEACMEEDCGLSFPKMNHTN